MKFAEITALVPFSTATGVHVSYVQRQPPVWRSPVILCCGMEAASMGKKPSKRRAALRLRDLDHSKSAILNSLGSPASRRAYEFAIDEFIAWYCSEPRLAFNRVVVTRYRLYLEARGLAASSINQRLAAVRRLAYEAADCGLLSPELAAGIRRVRGVKQLGRRSGNWLSLEQCSTILDVVTRSCRAWRWLLSGVLPQPGSWWSKGIPA